MFGSLMMLASGVVASAPSSASASSWWPERGEDAPGQGDVAQLELDPGRRGEGLDDRQQRLRGERRRLVGVRVHDLVIGSLPPCRQIS